MLGVASTVASALFGCVGSTVEDSPVLADGAPLRVESDQRAVSALVETADGHVVRGENTLYVTFSNADTELVAWDFFMPVHGHGTVPPEVSLVDEVYRIDALSLFMPGRWDVTLDLDVAGTEDRVFFSVQVP